MLLPQPIAHVTRALLAIALVFCATAAQAQWQYRDAQGRMVFSDQPPPPGTKDSDIIKGPGFTTNKPQAPRTDMPRPDMSGPKNSTPSATSPVAPAAAPAPAARPTPQAAPAAPQGQRGSTSRGVVYTDGTSGAPAAADGKTAPAKDAKAPASKDGKPAEKPLTPEEAFQKRQAEAREAEEKATKAKADADRKAQACNQNREALRSIESGQRIATTDAKGERVFLDDAQRAARAAQLRDAVAKTCN
jgi:hypothetical protein